GVDEAVGRDVPLSGEAGHNLAPGLVATRVSKIFMVMLKVESAGLRCGSSPSGSAGVAKRSDPPGLGAGACWARAGATMTAPIIAEMIQPSARVFMACTPFSNRPGGWA